MKAKVAAAVLVVIVMGIRGGGGGGPRICVIHQTHSGPMFDLLNKFICNLNMHPEKNTVITIEFKHAQQWKVIH